MGLEPFDFSCAVMLPNGTLADVRQTDIQRGKLRLHLSRTAVVNLEACPGDTRADKSRWVADALQTWVKAHGLSPDFELDLTVDADKDRVYRVGITSH
jgi:hypothetical protein